MTIEDEARAEAARRYPANWRNRVHSDAMEEYRLHFVKGAVWQASREVEATDEMVQRATSKDRIVVGWNGDFVDERIETARWSLARLYVVLVQSWARPTVVWLARKTAGGNS